MTVVAVTCIKNEADIIEPLVRHTCRLVDRLIVLDDGSRDDSLRILRALVDEGLPLEIIERHSLRKEQRERMTRLVCEEAGHRLQADWIIVLDADELLCLPPGLPLIPENASDEVCLRIPWRGYVALPDQDLQELNPVTRLRHRRLTELHPTFKVIVPGQLARRAGGRVEQGNHRYWIDDQPQAAELHPHCWLAHFPLRSPAQFLMRIVGTTVSYLAMPDRNPDWGWSCREPLERIKVQPQTLEAEFYEASRLYGIPHAREQQLAPELIEDPVVYLGGPLRYSPPTPSVLDVTAVLIRLAEDYALRHAVLTRPLNEDQLSDCDQQSEILATLQATLVARDQERSQIIGHLEQHRAGISERDRTIAERNRNITERDQTIAERNQNIAERDQNIARRDQNIAELQAELAQDRQSHAQQLQELRQTCEQQLHEAEEACQQMQQTCRQQLLEARQLSDQHLAELQEAHQQALTQAQLESARLMAELKEAYESSWTWRSGRFVSAPIRGLRAAVERYRPGGDEVADATTGSKAVS